MLDKDNSERPGTCKENIDRARQALLVLQSPSALLLDVGTITFNSVQPLQALEPKRRGSLQLTCSNEFMRMKHSSRKFVLVMRQPFMFQGK